MQYLLTFLEGVLAFISPCLLPLLPVYISYFAANGGRGSALKNALAFVLGFSLVFVLLGAFVGAAGGFLRRYETAVNIVTGLMVVSFGLHFLGILKIPGLERGRDGNMEGKALGFFPSLLFGVVFAVGWTPCVGVFLGSAILLAGQRGSAAQGVGLLLSFSLGLAIPFLLSALLTDRLKTAFDWIKRNYRIIRTASGGFLVVVGTLMMTGTMGFFLSLLTF